MKQKRYLVECLLSYLVTVEVEAANEEEAQEKALPLAKEEFQSARKHIIDPSITNISKLVN